MGENKIFLGSKILEVRAFQALSPVRLSVTDDELDDEGVADFPAVFFHISHWYLSWNTAGGDNCI